MKRGRVIHDGVVQDVYEREGAVVLADGRVVTEDAVAWLPPLAPTARPRTILALGLNYADHAKELSFKAPEEPLAFLKGPNALQGHRGHTWRPADVTFMHYECELVIVVGRAARRVRRENAYDFVAGYTVANDYAIRDYLENWYRPNLRVKNRDGCTPIGPWLVDAADVPDPMNLRLTTTVNDRVTQTGTTADMIFGIAFLIEYFSSFMTLAPGDIILTGTPDGTVDTRIGDVVVTAIEGIGALMNTIVDEPDPASPDLTLPAMRIDHLINGKATPGADYFETVNPATQEVLAEVAAGTAVDVDAAVLAAKEAFPGWAATPQATRAKLMRNLGELITKHVPEIAHTETDDTGQVIAQTKKQLVPRAADNFHFFAEVCTRMDGHTYPVDRTMLNYTLYQPVGVCALISPWNVPFMTATWKTAPCLALGNTAVLKMSELSPLTAARLGELALEAGIPRGVLNVVHGYGHTAGEALCRHPDVRAISFTGSTATGSRIVATAGLKKFSMELGGKSPFVIFEDADLERALDAALFMIYSNNGERCTAGSRILVQQSIYADFAQKFAARAARIPVGDPQDEGTVIGPMISRDHLAKVRSYIERGPREGATLLTGGLDTPALLPDRVRQGNYVQATVFADVRNDMRIAQDEIFGPVACLIAFEDEADAVRIANDIRYGLSSYVWTENLAKAHRVAAAIEAGMCFVNSQNVRDLRQPFGGIKASGTGREGGTWSFEVFTEPKNVCVALGHHPIPRWGL